MGRSNAEFLSAFLPKTDICCVNVHFGDVQNVDFSG